jgi:hypothetical protein
MAAFGRSLACPFSSPQGGDAAAAAIFPAVTPEKSDQPGVLGNLPRSRPGQRSEKRGGSRATTAATAAKPAAARSGAPTKRKAAAARKRAAARKPSPARRRAATSTTRTPARTPAAEPAPTSADPLTTAFHVAGKVAELGLKTAGGIIRRLPGL